MSDIRFLSNATLLLMGFSLSIAQSGLSTRWDDLIERQAAAVGFPQVEFQALTKAIVSQESAWNPAARNPSDPSTGLMQILVGPNGPYPQYSEAALADPTTNLTLGMAYLASLVRRYGMTSDAIAAYNAGRPRKNEEYKYVNSKGLTGVQAYVDAVQTYWSWYVGHWPATVSPDVPVMEWNLPNDDEITPQGESMDWSTAGLSGGLIILVLAIGLMAWASRS